MVNFGELVNYLTRISAVIVSLILQFCVKNNLLQWQLNDSNGDPLGSPLENLKYLQLLHVFCWGDFRSVRKIVLNGSQ